MNLIRNLLLGTLLTSTTAFAADVTVTEPYARAVPPGQPNSAVFMHLNNQGSDALKLVAASSPAAKVVELHTHTNDQGVMKMRRIDAIDLPTTTDVELRPGGLHVMLIGLTQDLNIGDEIELTLTYSDGDHASIKVPVKEVMPMGQQMQHQGGMGGNIKGMN